MKKNTDNEPRGSNTQSTGSHLLFSTAREHIILEPSKIVFCMAEGNYSRLYMQNGKTVFLCKQIGYLESLLPASLFARVHHSYLVNWAYVSGFLKKGGGVLQLLTGQCIPVSRRRKLETLRRWSRGKIPLIQ
jgi:two-component system, LytTR family, response regulator